MQQATAIDKILHAVTLLNEIREEIYSEYNQDWIMLENAKKLINSIQYQLDELEHLLER